MLYVEALGADQLLELETEAPRSDMEALAARARVRVQASNLRKLIYPADEPDG